jgi:hypothetical protein
VRNFEKMMTGNYRLNVEKNIEEINRITLDKLKQKVVHYLSIGIEMLKVEAELGEWLQTVYLKCGKQILILRSDESYPEKVNEIVLEVEDIKWMSGKFFEE